MRSYLRPKLRRFLAWLSIQAIKKHNLTLIAIVGNGERSIAREMIFEAINSTYPATRNLETPEAEFSVPLTILGFKSYPYDFVEWVIALVRIGLQFWHNDSFKHFVVLEIYSGDHELQNYWIRSLNPDMTVVTGNNQKLVLRTITIPVQQVSSIVDNYRNLAVKAATHFGVEEFVAQAVVELIDLPQGKISFRENRIGNLIIDARYYYFPISIKSVLEVVDLSNPTVLFTDNPHDYRYIKENNSNQVVVNPRKFDPKEYKNVILRGQITHTPKEVKQLLQIR